MDTDEPSAAKPQPKWIVGWWIVDSRNACRGGSQSLPKMHEPASLWYGWGRGGDTNFTNWDESPEPHSCKFVKFVSYLFIRVHLWLNSCRYLRRVVQNRLAPPIAPPL